MLVVVFVLTVYLISFFPLFTPYLFSLSVTILWHTKNDRVHVLLFAFCLLWIVWCQNYKFQLIDQVLVQLYWLDDLHHWLIKQDPSGLSLAFVFGNAKYIDHHFKRSLQFIGAYHVLVVSGYHMMLLRRFMTLCKLPDWLIGILMYAFFILSGCGIPCARALFMSSHLIKGKGRAFYYRVCNVWAIICMLYPMKVCSASLLLSMTAGAFLSMAYRTWRGCIAGELFMDVGVAAVLMPILYCFNMNASSWSWLLGPIIYPCIMVLAIMHALLVVIECITFLKLSWVLDPIDVWMHTLVVGIDEMMVDRGILQWPFVMCLLFALFFWFLCFLPSKKYFFASLVLLLLWSGGQWDNRSEIFQCFEVGHGLSCLWYKGRHAMLYDTARPRYGRQIHDYLQRHHIRLDSIVVSHSDIDHAGGLQFVKYDLKSTGHIYGSPITRVCNKKISNNCENIIPISFGFRTCHGSLCWYVLHPDQSLRTQNQMSVVVQLVAKRRILLTGDIDARVLRLHQSKQTLSDWFSDLWLPPHHGRTPLTASQTNSMGKERIVIGKVYLF